MKKYKIRVIGGLWVKEMELKYMSCGLGVNLIKAQWELYNLSDWESIKYCCC
jgi:hypothetical protein